MEFEDLPECCIANILCFTTPRDACALSLVSSTFKSAAKSDVVWERFIPSDYRTIIPTSLCFPSKKDLFLYLSHNPILIDAGQKSFVLDKVYGKKCYMLSARILFILWGDIHRHWKWTSLPNSRFLEVAELVSSRWFEIKGRIKSCVLSPETLYGAYLVFKPSVGGSYGFQYQPVEVSIGIVGEGDTQNRSVYLVGPTQLRPRYQAIQRRGATYGRIPYGLLGRIKAPAPPLAPIPASTSMPLPAPVPIPALPSIEPTRVGVEYPKERADRWWEIELGVFFNKGGEEMEVEMCVYEVKRSGWKGGIVLQGIEIRPKHPMNE